jgi:hypothetical protein
MFKFFGKKYISLKKNAKNVKITIKQTAYAS